MRIRFELHFEVIGYHIRGGMLYASGISTVFSDTPKFLDRGGRFSARIMIRETQGALDMSYIVYQMRLR